ncbi:MAG: DeoR/GlpR transcriptional regulator [Chelatococcus sp.]|jgi:DeoR family ulaG and ulaABCDEF operon transcriptional repressor|uniref:DeoR/GlpR family DNA-binding transcription regulator n=1 Tax=unclassified Chelatococcus TaxID=2638111 RepID=UPI001BCFDB8D|nr:MULTISPECIES: DeoR/GlpR family DNA-binding transcription regulator [unclassified Chelatococcus]CAH1658719.1 DeoR/GlpR transcriptional regulator [Hyphomicrobiales bacterium]MBS7742133.1 DeoR/GlpR transcriptional regulator [Chelatococcus sp. HY11]MBX3538499.1 DeoR/GlpR transcriptional regulator [Chelatococcus sp.]MBX3542749.1 DeoR/GlpR transcriptional regulator [Chelatococcus sp.]MCO5075035.1 DeoR/GlpR family DNA-binding transcription regulator [Chelatococcus sp.]
MHERERHRIILSAIQGRPVASVQEIMELTGASEATIRRDISALALQKKLRKVRGGAEALNPSPYGSISGRPFHVAEVMNTAQKRAIARAAVDLCEEGDAVIINGGTTTFQMVHHLTSLRLHVLTNSFSIAEHLLKHSKCTVLVPAGAIYREQNLILSPFENDGIAHFRGRRMFMGAQGVSSMGIAEADPLIIQSEQRLMRQAEEIVLMVDSSKFLGRSAMIVAPLERVSTIITDDRLSDAAAKMIGNAGIRLIVAQEDRDADRDNDVGLSSA